MLCGRRSSQRVTSQLARLVTNGPNSRPHLCGDAFRRAAISQFVANSVREKAKVLLNGVADDDPVDPVAKVVLAAQRLEPEKRTQDTIDAWNASRLAEEGWELWIAGDGSERASLQETVARAQISGSSATDPTFATFDGQLASSSPSACLRSRSA